jgi:hypothetical protein
VKADVFKAGPDDTLAAHFAGDKAKWRAAYNALATEIHGFGPDITLSLN